MLHHGFQQDFAAEKDRRISLPFGNGGGGDGRKSIETGQRVAPVHQLARPRPRQFTGETAQMLLQPRPPFHMHTISRLQGWPGLARGAAMH